MEKIPASLEFAEKIMRIDLIKFFDIPLENRKMGEALTEFIERGGKYIRPAIVFSTAKMYDLDPLKTFYAALSLHLDHNFFLIHDDIEDGSYWRRGKPTVHILYGDDNAINYGDYSRTLAEQAMDKGSEVWDCHTYKRLVEARHEMLKTTCEGQDLEFQLRAKPLEEMTLEKILNIYRNKTAFYTTFTGYRYGCIVAGQPDEYINQLKPPLINIGIAFQIQDDSLDLTVPKEEEMGEATLIIKKFGKDWAGDLEEIKRTLPLYYLYNRAKENDLRYIREKLDVGGEMRKLVMERDKLRREGVNENDPTFKRIVNEIDEIKIRVIKMMHDYRAIEDSQTFAKELYEKSISQIKSALPESEGKKELLELFHFCVFRTF